MKVEDGPIGGQCNLRAAGGAIIQIAGDIWLGRADPALVVDDATLIQHSPVQLVQRQRSIPLTLEFEEHTRSHKTRSR